MIFKINKLEKKDTRKGFTLPLSEGSTVCLQSGKQRLPMEELEVEVGLNECGSICPITSESTVRIAVNSI